MPSSKGGYRPNQTILSLYLQHTRQVITPTVLGTVTQADLGMETSLQAYNEDVAYPPEEGLPKEGYLGYMVEGRNA